MLSSVAAPPRARVEQSSRMSAEEVVQDHGAVRTVGLASSEAVTGDREDACSISAVGDNGVSSGECRNDVSGAFFFLVLCLFIHSSAREAMDTM